MQGSRARLPLARTPEAAPSHHDARAHRRRCALPCASTHAAPPAPHNRTHAAAPLSQARCLCWAAYFHFLATERRYAAELTARAMGYNNVAIAVVGAAGPYLLTHVVASLTSTEGDRYHDVKVRARACTHTLCMLFVCGLRACVWSHGAWCTL